ncbi:phosphate acetyltransferase [Nakamurella sp. YIM 132087]|uniref:Phosphate acetyltransferase n=1 Tax=Nakamurella alba TaxID=2665158 RepID=A0A7K1FMT7_9ACTN|nr:phosphate acetyltransferase [Nakamurella alba]MTD15400.1 phosphate acetyltransferase [Nakamurella alba]
MSRSVYIASPEGESGKSTVALGLADLLTRRVGRVGVFRPVTESVASTDLVVELLLDHPGIEQGYADAIGVGYADMHRDQDAALSTIVEKFHALSARYEVLIVLGSDYTDVSTPNELAFNARVAANLGVPVVLVVHGRGRTPAQVRTAVDMAASELAAAHAHPIAVIANRVEPADLDAVRAALAAGATGPVAAIPEVPLLVAPTVGALLEACDGRLVRGSTEWLERESLGFVVAAMSLPNVLIRLHEDVTVIAPGDRSDLLPGLVMAHQSGTFPHLSAIVLTGGYAPPEPVARLIEGVQQDLPIIVSDGGTFETAAALAAVRGRLSAGATAKIETARRVFAESVDGEALLDAMDLAASQVVTPLMFQHRLLDRARSRRRHIVLPEGEDPRILAATASLLRLGVAELTLLGDENSIRAKASAAGLDIGAATILSPHEPELVEKFAVEYARIRERKGMTVERAREIVTDVSYFGTMMVHLGMADGMVSGAMHTTAHTIRPGFEIIRTAPGTAIVSSVFLMCLADRVLVYGDCAVNPDPTAEQLADIAVSSAATAAQFGIDPRVAMLSYSTGTSGAGADVEKVREATDVVHRERPDLLVEGPIQYDAAVDPSVAASKMPDSAVAGRATVLIFPDLNTGNNTYKAVQRSAGAVAIGPVLQGLNKPVNDLSRGALVADIVNTVAITAIQAAESGASDVVAGEGVSA